LVKTVAVARNDLRGDHRAEHDRAAEREDEQVPTLRVALGSLHFQPLPHQVDRDGDPHDRDQDRHREQVVPEDSGRTLRVVGGGPVPAAGERDDRDQREQQREQAERPGGSRQRSGEAPAGGKRVVRGRDLGLVRDRTSVPSLRRLRG
jgi:hypothetical protein